MKKSKLYLVLAVLSLGAIARAESTNRVFDAVHLFYSTDDFTDEKIEGVGVGRFDLAPAASLRVSYMDAYQAMVISYKHIYLISDDASSLIYRVNKRPPVTISCKGVPQELEAVVVDQLAGSDLLKAIVEEDRLGPVKIVLMVVGQSETKAEFDMEGTARAIDASRYLKSRLNP